MNHMRGNVVLCHNRCFFGAEIEALRAFLAKDTRYEVMYQTKNQIIYQKK